MFAKFVLVGCMNTILSFSIIWALSQAGVSQIIAVGVGYFLGGFNGLFWHSKIFPSSNVELFKPAFLFFYVVIIALCSLASNFLSYKITQSADVGEKTSLLWAVGITYPLLYFLVRKLFKSFDGA